MAAVEPWRLLAWMLGALLAGGGVALVSWAPQLLMGRSTVFFVSVVDATLVALLLMVGGMVLLWFGFFGKNPTGPSDAH